MKKVQLAIAAIAVAIAFAGTTVTKANDIDEQQYYFVSANGNDDGLRTANSETALRGCDNTKPNLCATGYLDPAHTQPAITLKKQ